MKLFRKKTKKPEARKHLINVLSPGILFNERGEPLTLLQLRALKPLIEAQILREGGMDDWKKACAAVDQALP